MAGPTSAAVALQRGKEAITAGRFITTRHEEHEEEGHQATGIHCSEVRVQRNLQASHA